VFFNLSNFIVINNCQMFCIASVTVECYFIDMSIFYCSTSTSVISWANNSHSSSCVITNAVSEILYHRT